MFFFCFGGFGVYGGSLAPAFVFFFGGFGGGGGGVGVYRASPALLNFVFGLGV